MEAEIIFIEPSSPENTNDMSMDIFALDETAKNDIKAPTEDSNISADIFDISDDDDEEEQIPSPSNHQENDNSDDSDSIEIISSQKNKCKSSEKENIVDDMDDCVEIISPKKKEPKPFFIPPNPNKPKTDLTQFLKIPEPSKEKKFRLTPIRKKNAKEEAKKNLTNILGGSNNIAAAKRKKPGQRKMDAYVKWKDGKEPDVMEVIPSKVPSLKPSIASRNYRTPSPPPTNRRHRLRSDSPTYSPLPPAIAAQFKAALESSGPSAAQHSSVNTILEKAKEEAKKKPKCKFSRAIMNGYECRCCKDYYDAMGLEGDERREYVNKVSKHRGFEQAPPTPPRYWDIDVPSHEEQIELGYVIETDSPLIKTKKKPKI